jgi:phage portal protein BeeE
LSIQGYQNGAAMADSPRLIVRPDPDTTPRDFYSSSTWNMASRGETVWYIASFDSDGKASALVVVPLWELNVEENERNRRRPVYRWGTITSTRWSPTNQTGRFVHVFLTREPFALRGRGPLQLGQAAVSVSVEAQDWAARLYSKGGYPSVVLHNEEVISDEEAVAARTQWSSTPSNTPQVTSGTWSVNEFGVNPQGAQMLDARSHQDGDAARLFGVPGSLVEFNAPGSSLTYQNIGEVFALFVKTCLQPDYLEPMEQALTDLLPRTTVARFSVDAFYRPDMKARWEVYEIASKVLGVEAAAQWAREKEGFEPGDIEFKPVPFAPPAALSNGGTYKVLSSEVRCNGSRLRNGRMESCGRLLAERGPFVGRCPRCKKEYAAA